MPAFELFVAVRTQWRHGMAGPTGLDYASVCAYMALTLPTDCDRPRLLEDLQVMEAAVLQHFRQRS